MKRTATSTILSNEEFDLLAEAYATLLSMSNLSARVSPGTDQTYREIQKIIRTQKEGTLRDRRIYWMTIDGTGRDMDTLQAYALWVMDNGIGSLLHCHKRVWVFEVEGVVNLRKAVFQADRCQLPVEAREHYDR